MITLHQSELVHSPRHLFFAGYRLYEDSGGDHERDGAPDNEAYPINFQHEQERKGHEQQIRRGSDEKTENERFKNRLQDQPRIIFFEQFSDVHKSPLSAHTIQMRGARGK